ncbi:MotE family protein [Alkalibacillus almallahensis]|uniref:MotE family protein n=1 Tax=Alkalibacillus almallahensis TaxID=1379154 RepID=UPI00141E88D9|nr:MotE family protein [Alkalibacillus almallahensis]
MDQNKETNTSKFQWFLFVIIIPVIFAITLVLIISTFAGVNPIEKAQEYGSQMPVVGSFVSTPEEETQEQQLANHEATIQDQKATIDELEATINTKDQEIEELSNEINQLTEQLESQEETQASREESISQLARSFTEMNEENAASVMANMEQSVVLDILEGMNDGERGTILAEMDAELAATLSNALVQRSNGE